MNMRNDRPSQIEKVIKERTKRKWWQRAVSILSAVAVFCTTYAMILPAITWERSLLCEIPAHRHNESCYEMKIVPGEKELVCLETEHEHGPECYIITDNLICGLEECEGHTHGEGCFDEAGVLICTLEESEGHSHSEACYEKELDCQIPEHVHSEDCWAEGEPHEKKVLMCQLEEHEHSAACFDAPPAEDDGYYCGQIEHVHSEKQYCYFSDGSLRCTIPEHVHTLACKSNPNADVESEAKWCSTFANVSLTGNWAEDVIAIAKTQLGYTESTRNYEVQEDGTTIKGYTRYGDWYGNSYGDWCAMFCSFCLNYAEVDRDLMPIEASCQHWIEALEEDGLYYAAEDYEPKPGDIVFFNFDEDVFADHVGFVYEIHEDGLTTIEGNWGDCVCTVDRKLADDEIIGYGALPKNPEYKPPLKLISPKGSYPTVILACSDVQEPSNSYLYSNGDYTAQAELLDNIMSQVRTTYPAVTDFFCGGDYNFDITRTDNQYKENNKTKTYTSSLATDRTQQDAEWLSNEILSNFPTVGNIVLTQGNHDQFCNALTPTGGYNMGSYSVYVINEGDYPSGGSSQSLCQQTADGLRSWLNGLVQANYNKPVFILTHVPLHYSNRVARDSDAIYAQLLYDAIAAYGDDLNIIFLYGHDHGAGDDDYLGGASVFLTRGDTITIAQAGSTSNTIEKTLNFTYMNYGFVGYFWDLWNQSQGPINYATDYALTMTTFEISGSDVIISRWDENGRHILKAAGAASLGLRGVPDSLPPDTKTYASPQCVYSPKNSEVELQTIEDNTGVTITAICSSVTVEKMGSVTALDNAGITDYLAFDISVENLEGSATVTMPTRPGYNMVWHVNAGGELETISNAEFDGYTVTFTADEFSPFGSGKAPDSMPETPDEPVAPVTPEDLLTFTKNEVPTSVTDGTATGTENVHTITLDIVPPEQKKVAVLMLIDATSSMYLQCANCGVELDYHAGGAKAGQPSRTTNWDGNAVSYYACDHFVERHDIADSAARAFINQLAASGNQVYIKLVPFGNIAKTDYTGWLDLSQSGKVAEAQTALGNIQNISGTDISNVLRKACDILSNDLAPGMSSEDTYVLLLTDGCQAVNDTNVPAEALTSSYIQKWKNIWSTYTHYDEVLIDTNGGPTPAGYYIAAPYYAEQIEDDAGLNSHLYSVMLGQCIDDGNRNRNNNWLYTPGIGITAQDYVKSFSDYSSFITDASGMNDYYTMVSNQLVSTLVAQTLTVTDPMSDYVDFLGFTDANGQPLLSNPTEAAYNTGTRTITWEPMTADSDGHYRLYYNVRIKTEAEGFVKGQLYPANKTTTASYTLQYTDGTTDNMSKNADIPEITGMLGELEFTKISADGTPLSGAQFKLVHDADCECGASFADIIFVSNTNGNATVDIPSGHTYKLYEATPPAGYAPFPGYLNVVVSYGTVTVTPSADAAAYWNATENTLIDPANTTTLTIAKEVVGVANTGSFPFEVILSDAHGNPVLLMPGTYTPTGSDVSYTVDINGKITFALSHGQSVIIDAIPIGTIATVTETQHNGFNVKFTDPNGYVNNSATDNFNLTNAREITVTNMAGAELPATGGIGVYPIYALGVLLVTGSIMYGCILRRKRERRAE